MCIIVQQYFPLPLQYHLSALIENNKVESTANEAIGCTVIRVTTQVHKIILYTAIILTFG